MLRFDIPNMTCGGCANSVTKALQTVDSKALVSADPAKRQVVIDTSASEASLRAALEEAGYPAAAAAA